MIFAAIFIIVAILVIAVVHVWRSVCAEHSWLPRYLARGRLLFSEYQVRCDFPLRLVARVDRAYLVDGVLHLLELKTRRSAVVHETDVIELSAQRVAVEGATGRRVSMDATVIIESREPHRRTVRKVKLLTARKVADLLRRRQSILAGYELAGEARSSAQCVRCEFRRECKGEATALVVPVVFRPSIIENRQRSHQGREFGD